MNPLTIGIMGLIVIAVAALLLLGRRPAAAAAPAAPVTPAPAAPPPTNWLTRIKAVLTRLMERAAGIPSGEFETKALRLMLPWNPAAPTSFLFNPECWAAPLDWTGLAQAIDGAGTMGGGTLISRRHILLADHVLTSANATIYFANKAGTTFQYQIVQRVRIGDSDIAIGTLDRDVDPSLKVYRVLADGWEQKVSDAQIGIGMPFGEPWMTMSMRLPVLYTNQDRFALTADVTLVQGTVGRAMLADVEPPSFQPAQAFYRVQRGGDSGNPIFTLVGDELVLLGAWFKVGQFPWLISQRSQVEAVMGRKLETA